VSEYVVCFARLHDLAAPRVFRLQEGGTLIVG
jgi:hypothetical protein